MRFRSLGETGLKVSEVSFGTIPILSGNVPVLPNYYSPNDETAIAIMQHAWELGCNLFDTAIVPEYGDAEIKLGKFAKTVGRENIIISDKSRFFDGNDMYKAVQTSCENLECCPDIYFVHQVDESNVDMVFGTGGALDALCELKKEGKIGFTGIASHYYSVLLRGAKDKRVDVLQGSGNILERGMLDRIENEPLFQSKGLILNKVYAAGILTDFFTIEELISGVLTYPISTALIGLGTMEQVDIALGKEFQLHKRPTFTQVLTQLEERFTPISCDRCQKCKCPYGTEIHILFRQYNYYFLGKDFWALRKLDMGIKENAEFCRKCTTMTCVDLCPRKNKIPIFIQKIEELVKVHVRNSII